jgi:hypothetical protein
VHYPGAGIPDGFARGQRIVDAFDFGSPVDLADAALGHVA